MSKKKRKVNKLEMFIDVGLLIVICVLFGVCVACGMWGAWTEFAVCFPITVALIPIHIVVSNRNAYFVCKNCGRVFKLNPFKAWFHCLPSFFGFGSTRSIYMRCPYCTTKEICCLHFGKISDYAAELKESEKVSYYGCYKFKRRWLAIEMVIDESSDALDFRHFVVPEEGLLELDFQVAYLEQYLNADGTERICKTDDTPEPPVKPSRILFFIYKTGGGDVLRTPYGEFSIAGPSPMPKRLRPLIKFEEED